MDNNTLLGIPFSAWAVLCLSVAGIYAMVWPRPRPNAPARPPWMRLVLRWAHPLVWVLLAGVCLLMAVNATTLAELLAYLAALLYVTFMVTMFLDRRRGKAKNS